MASAPIEIPTNVPLTAKPKRSDTIWGRLLRHPLAWSGAAILGLLLILAAFAPYLTPLDPTTIFESGLDELGVPAAPGAVREGDQTFLIGADTLGRDLWTRLLYGLRLSLVVALCAMVTSTLIGTTIGLLGGFFGGWVDAFLTRVTEVFAALPTILLAITLAVVLPSRVPDTWAGVPLLSRWVGEDLSTVRLLLAIGLVTWTGIARVVRGEVLSLREREFVEAARSLGASPGRILTRHLLPNVAPTVVALATLATAHNILLEAGLSYLGLGKPEAASLGGTIAEGQAYFGVAPWIVLAPGALIVLAVAGFNLLGNALSEAVEGRR